MIQKGQMTFMVQVPSGQDPSDVHAAMEQHFKDQGVLVEGYSWADMNDQFDIIGLDNKNQPWEATINAATEAEALAQVPKNVKVAKISQVSIFATVGS
jgi:hypothetical protein